MLDKIVNISTIGLIFRQFCLVKFQCNVRDAKILCQIVAINEYNANKPHLDQLKQYKGEKITQNMIFGLFRHQNGGQ